MTSNEPVVHIGENSPEHVALSMTKTILTSIEGKRWGDISRKEFLDTYAECIRAVRGYRSYPEMD